mmetsp:Transcript_29443/g.78174  ORF Transcript_29443/g.78174 Transcript_29443/m.78174 type:complete len:98 (+) Transcript_29443:826-1119(+)
MTTMAQAEGAIEGTGIEYKMASGFATDFKYSRFDAVKAAARDLKTLQGKRIQLDLAGHGAASSLGESSGDDETTADAITRAINRIHPQLNSFDVAEE